MEINKHIERTAREATADYAQRVKKPMPQLEDYAYGMDLDVGKLVYVCKRPANTPSESQH